MLFRSLERHRAHWDSFVEYKNSELARQRSEKNKENAKKKIYHHKMGTGGYRTAEPKWDQTEAAMREKGIITATESWPHRVRNWILGHGAEYDMETGELKMIPRKKILYPRKQLLKQSPRFKRESLFPTERETS